MSQAQVNALVNTKEKRTSIKEQILKFIKDRESVNEYQIKALLNVKRATLIGRLSELQDDGLIYVKGTFNGKMNSIYKYEPNETKQKALIKERQDAKRDKWLKVGKLNNWL